MSRSGFRYVVWGLGVVALTTLSPLFSGLSCAAPVDVKPKKTLQAFTSDAELAQALAGYQAENRLRAGMSGAMGGKSMVYEFAPVAALVKADAAPAAGSVTNNQTAGVDEGDIVKAHGRYLVILRRGRLFTVDVGRKPGDAVTPVSAIPAYAPAMQPNGWYDEMLISGDTVIVISYSYQRNGTEVGLFDIDSAGHLSYRSTYYLRSNDYYSSRNYASRLIGNKLVFYTPLVLGYDSKDPFASFPALDRWRGKGVPADFKRIAPANHIYRVSDDSDGAVYSTLHTVQVCDLSKREMTCKATAVLGPYGSQFYVSADSVYVWVDYPRGAKKPDDGGTAAVYRLPLDGAAPSMLKTAGNPVDQFSFLQSADGYLNVLLRNDSYVSCMWSPEKLGSGSMMLLRVGLNQFSDGQDAAPDSAYHRTPSVDNGPLQNRFIGDWLLYGVGGPFGGDLHALRWATPDAASLLDLPHDVKRIEALGRDAVVVGLRSKDLLFSAISLGDDKPGIAGQYRRRNAAQGESRSHGFFYRADDRLGGVIGLPVIGGGEKAGRDQLRDDSAAILFLRNSALQLSELGALNSDGKPASDNCQASCVDWYGNARPLFLGDRVFALMGYELVEGRIDGEHIREMQRASFAPAGKWQQ